MMHPDDYADERRDPDALMRTHVPLRYAVYAALVVYIGTLSWIGHVAWAIQWVGN